MNPKVSIIVPAYKVENYLHKCIDSILAQTLSDFELILVNDGSPDNCGEICDEYAIKDSRVRVIHKENGGLATARNAGINIAKGEYIGFVDSDDWIEPNMYELLYGLCVENECEIANCSSIIYFKDRTVKNGSHSLIIHNRQEAMKAMLEGQLYDEVVWTKLFKRSLFGETRFKEGAVYEDTDFTYKLIHKSNKVGSIGAPMYHYIKRDNSTMDQAIKNIRIDSVVIYDQMYKFMEKNYPELLGLVTYKLANCAMVILNLISKHPNFKDFKKQYYQVAAILNNYYGNVIKLGTFPNKVKILLLALRCHPIFYKFIINKI